MHHSLLPPSATCACTALRKASRAVTRLYDEALHDSGLSIVQFALLRNLQRQGTLPLMELAELLVMERTTLYRALGPLERHGWVSIADGKGRSKTATLTAQGGKAIARAIGAWEGAQRALLSAIGLPDWAILESALRRLTGATQGLVA